MEDTAAETRIVYTQKEMQQYSLCPEINFVGGHTSGFTNCPYCANVYRTYRRLQNEVIDYEKIKQAEEERKEAEKEEEMPAAKPKSLEETEECTKLMCMKAGWCMCE